MAWVEANGGVFQRSIGENEKFIKLIGDRAHALGREQWSVTATATFKCPSVDQRRLVWDCRAAWKCTRFENPSIASTATEDNLSYVVPDEQSLDEWVDESLSLHEDTLSVEDVIAQLKPSRYTTAHLFPNLDKTTIILHLAHWRTDAYGALNLVDAFLTNLALIVENGEEGYTKGENLAWGQEVVRLVPSVEEALGLPVEGSEAVSDIGRQYLSKAALLRGAVGLQYNHNSDEPVMPGGTRSERYTLSASKTRAVIEGADSRGISLFGAIHASCATATYAGAASQDLDKPYTSTMRFSLLPHLKLSHNRKALAAGLYTGGYPFQIDASRSWIENARTYSNEYENGISPEFLECRREYAKQALKMLQQVPSQPPPDPSEIDISTVQDADQLVSRQYHAFKTEAAVLEVSDISVGVETLSKQMYCFAWIFGGRLQLNIVYNEAFYDSQKASRTLAILVQILLTELAI